MPRQSISSTKPDDEWLKAQMDWLRAKLEISEKSGFTTDTKEQILNCQSLYLMAEYRLSNAYQVRLDFPSISFKISIAMFSK